jgi:cyclophilin family peptidyl-prolyl cis-trans isomerase
VTQWGDATEKKPFPATAAARPAAEYDFPPRAMAQRLSRADAYSKASGVGADGWPLATDGTVSWIPHCYGTVGVARGDAPDTGSGSELFVAIGGSARRLDRNYTIVGRVIEGMQYLSSLPRGTADMGFYSNESDHTRILSIRLASDISEKDRPRFQYRAADNVRFTMMVARKEHSEPPTVALGGIDVCDVPLPVRSMPSH